MNVPVLAGTISTVLFAASMLPMLLKAARTKDLASYSVGNIVITNVANAVHSVYIFDLPAGPLWLLHSFYVVASVLMLIWCLRYRQLGDRQAEQRTGEPAAAVARVSELRIPAPGSAETPRRPRTSMPIPSLKI